MTDRKIRCDVRCLEADDVRDGEHDVPAGKRPAEPVVERRYLRGALNRIFHGK